MFREIGLRYASTAGGVVATMELLGAVVLPTYVVIPLCGGSYTAFFVAGGILLLCSALCSLFVNPEPEAAS